MSEGTYSSETEYELQIILILTKIYDGLGVLI